MRFWALARDSLSVGVPLYFATLTVTFEDRKMIAEASRFNSSDLRDSGDGQIRAAAVEALNSAQYSALRNLTCRVVDGTAEITGTVPSYYLKQLAQTAVAQLPGVVHVRNLVVVRE